MPFHQFSQKGLMSTSNVHADLFCVAVLQNVSAMSSGSMCLPPSSAPARTMPSMMV